MFFLERLVQNRQIKIGTVVGAIKVVATNRILGILLVQKWRHRWVAIVAAKNIAVKRRRRQKKRRKSIIGIVSGGMMSYGKVWTNKRLVLFFVDYMRCYCDYLNVMMKLVSSTDNSCHILYFCIRAFVSFHFILFLFLCSILKNIANIGMLG